MTTAATRAPTPTNAAIILDPLALPVTASRVRAMIGMPSFTKLFQMPDTTSDTCCGTWRSPTSRASGR